MLRLPLIAVVCLTAALWLPGVSSAAEPARKKVVFVAGGRSHGFGSHDHRAGCHLLASHLERSGLPITCEVIYPGWPKDLSAFDGAAAIVIYCDGGGGHPVHNRVAELDSLMKKGIGLGCIHYAVEAPKGPTGDALLKYTGGYFETQWSVNPHWLLTDPRLAVHPATRGVSTFSIRDEWYYHMRFPENMQGVQPIISALPPPETITGRWKLGSPPGNHNGNPAVHQAVVVDKKEQHVMWARERPEGGRGFGFTGGHFHWNWANDSQRKIILNAIAWIAGVEVPAQGVKTAPVTLDEMLANHDDAPAPDKLNRAAVAAELKRVTGRDYDLTPVKSDAPAIRESPSSGAPSPTPKPAGAAGDASSPAAPVKPVAQSKLITVDTPGHATDIEANITGAKELHLVVNDGGDGYGCDWACWDNPRLIDASGKETPLTSLRWRSAESGHGSVQIDKNSSGQPLRIAGRPVPKGIGTHANSVISYDLPAGHPYVQFKARAGLDNGGTDQGCGSTVQFAVYTQSISVNQAVKSSAAKAGREPQDATAGLDVHEALQVELFAAEPMLMNPSNIDIDHRGRVWVAEIVNYRGRKGARPEGDRIVILEDKDGDGKADNAKTFYQAKDFISPHGVTVFANPTGKNTRVFVAVGDKVIVLTDADGDDQADSMEVLFSGISGVQHDHGIHQVMMGPDGKLYFNFGNSGHQIKDPKGAVIIDLAGNRVEATRKPYQEGMIFRCNPDGSQFETLAWNFRNNWMNTVDAFGGIWQSDNDDDGNRAVRINYVVEFGNYGYRHEITGAGWTDPWKKAQAAGASEDLRAPYHWHQSQPGVMPNLLHTGGGSPTGICVYEAGLLPEVFRGQVIHCDAGPNVVRAYPAAKAGAGYTATMLPILTGNRDKWFRPSDVKVAPDGSLIVADWYDPGVGGHGAGDLDRGRIFRVTPKGHKGYQTPRYDFSTPQACVEALKSPTPSVRSIAWTELHRLGAKAEPALRSVWDDTSAHPRKRARVLWLLGKIEGRGPAYVDQALKDRDADLRVTALRLARQLPSLDVEALVAELLTRETDPHVLRECAVALRHSKSDRMPELWARLALKHNGADRWYLEALGLASDLRAEACYAAYLAQVGDPLKLKGHAAAGARDIIWRVRAKAALPSLAAVVKQATGAEKDRLMLGFDFHPKSSEKDAALLELLQ